MQFTLIGIIWCFLLAVGLIAPWKYLITLLSMSSVLQASVLFNMGNSGFSLFLATEITIIIKSILLPSVKIRIQKRFILYLTVFVIYSIFISLFMSFSSLGISRYSLANKIILVLIHYITAFSLGNKVIQINGIQILKIHLLSLGIVIICGYIILFSINLQELYRNMLKIYYITIVDIK